MAIEQWGFFRVPHLLWHGSSVYNDYLRWSVTLSPIAERLVVVLSLPTLRLRSLASANWTLIFRMRGQRSVTSCVCKQWTTLFLDIGTLEKRSYCFKFAKMLKSGPGVVEFLGSEELFDAPIHEHIPNLFVVWVWLKFKFMRAMLSKFTNINPI